MNKRYSDTVVNQYGAPVNGANILVLDGLGAGVTVYDAAGQELAQPIVTINGAFEFHAPQGEYVLDVFHADMNGGSHLQVPAVVIGFPVAMPDPLVTTDVTTGQTYRITVDNGAIVPVLIP